jgi:site-specific DNA recombinase
VQRNELQRVSKEIQRTFDLYQQEKLDTEGFSRFHAPLEERRKQMDAAIPRLEAELDILKMDTLSAEEIANRAKSLYDRWQTMPLEEKREVVELITDRIVVAKDEITISLFYSPSCKDMANRWRKGWDSNPR